MKKILITCAALLFLQSCSDDYYDSLNVDNVHSPNVPASALVTNATTSYFYQMLNTNVNSNVFRLYAQQWNETQYVEESNYDLETRNINGRLWTELNTNIIYDLTDAKKIVEKDSHISDDVKKNQIAIIELIQVQAWMVMVDTFGDVPYTEASKGDANLSPKYDDAKSIYTDLLNRLQESLAQINVSHPGFGTQDIVYNGDMGKWKKFGGSLLLKLGVQVADADNAMAQTAIQLAISNGVMESDEDSYRLNYPGSEPNVNPLWVDLVASGRKDFVAANTIIDYMNDLEDPRREKYFRQNLGDGVYLGGVYGNATPFRSYTQISDTLHEKSYPGNLLDVTETKFLLAEAAAKGFSVGGTVESFYEEAIKESFAFWGLSEAEADAYLANPKVNFATAEGTWKEKLGKQFYLALYNKGFDAWTVYRRLDSPKMNVAATSGLNVPTRFTYPTAERNLNGANNSAAATAIGGDKLDTKLFWDKY